MDQPPASGGGGGGPAPFLLKTYDMVDDSSTDEIVSWCPDKKDSFIVWNPPEFARLLLPTYFKHNNFSSFIRQLNTYGFRKIDPERWEFSNEDFVKDQKHLLKNIHRRKPIHSHSHTPGSAVDPERVAFEEEIERLLREKAVLEDSILKRRQQRSAAQIHVGELTQRCDSMKMRQESLLAFLEKAVQEPTFVERLARKLESVDVSAYKKKRRLPQAEQSKPVAETNLLDDDSSARPELGSIFDQDFSNKLRLELSPAISLSDVNLASCSTQSSNEDGSCPLGKASERDTEDTNMRTECPVFVPESLDVSDTGTSFVLKMDSYFPQKAPMDGGSGAQVLHQRFGSGEDADANVSCQLKLALASSPLRGNRSPFSSRIAQQAREIENLPEADSNANTTESGPIYFPNNRDAHEEETTKMISKEFPAKNQEHTAKPVRVNDIFWEQFLTERPGSSDNEEACSNYRANAFEEQEERRSGNTIKKSFKSLEQLSL